MTGPAGDSLPDAEGTGTGKHYAVVGACAAGVAAAFAMREHGFTGRITLFDSAPELPYRRPLLSKVLAASDEALLRPIAPRSEYAERGVDLRLGVGVERLDPVRRVVGLDDGTEIDADLVLLATGVSARVPQFAGIDLDGVMTLRHPSDARRLAAAVGAGEAIVVVGGGFIGMEVAAVARSAGCDVTVLELAAAPMLGALGPELAERVTQLHREEGVVVRTGVVVRALHGEGRVREVELSDGTRLPAGAVVVGVGVVPNDRLASSAGVTVENGIVVDCYGRTSDPWIWAAGDVTVQPHPRLAAPGRIEHWDNAVQQGTAVGAAMAGTLRPHDALPYFWSEQYGLQLQMVGRALPGDVCHLRPDAQPRRFVALWSRAGKLVAMTGLGAGRDVVAARRLLDRPDPVDIEPLLEPGADLRALSLA